MLVDFVVVVMVGWLVGFYLWAQYTTTQLLISGKGENSMLALLRESGEKNS